MKQLVISVLVVLLFLVSCGGGRKGDSSSASKAISRVIPMSAERAAKYESDSIRLGRVNQGEIVEYRFGMVNTDTLPMIVLGVIKGCGCTSVEYDMEPTMPGDTLAFTLQYDAGGQSGHQVKIIQVMTSLYEHYHNIYLHVDVAAGQ